MRALLSGIVVVTTIGVLIGFRSSVQRVLGISTTSAASAQLTGFYLDIGASSSLGTQPDGVRAHNGHRTKSGYSDDLVSFEARHSMALTMREIGCPGETVQSMLGQLKDACYTLPNTQLTIATNYLATHTDEVGVVTLDLGFNNIRACLTATVTLTSCVQRGIVAVRNDLPIISVDSSVRRERTCTSSGSATAIRSWRTTYRVRRDACSHNRASTRRTN